MDAWIDIRRKARVCHNKALQAAKGDRSAQALVTAARELEDLELRHFKAGETFGAGVLGLLERDNGIVNVLENQDPADEAVIVAHELGHFHLHRDPQHEIKHRQLGLGGDPIETGAGKVEGYSTRERKEIQADIFAGEFLCPSDWLREQSVDHGRKPVDLAKDLGLPPNVVLNQMVRALLLPPLSPPPTASGGDSSELDASQKKAAEWKGHVLVEAGPGTGKTRTLVARVAHLLTTNGPASLLALTFSKRAAEEMRERIGFLDADAAIEMWAGTFHAFGQELIQKWPSAVRRTSKVRTLDEAGQLALLEENLAELPLRHYQNLYEPAYELVNILRAISRCKDEGISPQQYLNEANTAFENAMSEEQRDEASRAIEVGEVYTIYEKTLVEADAVDFGDLVLLAAKLVEENPEVKAYVAGFKHVLVDEYQDVNFASARLLRAICSAGAEAWVVADQRQSIYRFRGASPNNVERFTSEFEGTRHSLDTNYRSFAPIVQTFELFSATMGSAGKMKGSWRANRAQGGAVSMTVAPELAAEAEAIRDNIEAMRAQGIPYREQAILARTHLTLARITGVLEQLGVPMVYLGDLFERDEISTLLSLVSIDAEHGGIGLIRIATLPEYNASREDALAVVEWARDNKTGIFEALRRVPEISSLSSQGAAGLSKLGHELTGLERASPWTLLTTWLFERSDYLRSFLSANHAIGQQKLIAIYHLLKFCSEQAIVGQNSRKSFLARIRRLEALNYDSSFRRVASEAADMDAVRVMTIHGSKGLEFKAVHLPAIATRYMPASRQGIRCPPPQALTQLVAQPEHHEAEEESLFFVGLSRARDYLFLSRAERYTATAAKESKFLASIKGAILQKKVEGSGTIYGIPTALTPPGEATRYEERDLETYMKCPARYRYTVIEQMRGGRDESPYVSFHRCVYAIVRWLESEREKGVVVDLSTALARLQVEWQESGPVKPEVHPLEPYYRRAAENMIREMVAAIASETARYERKEWEIPVGKHCVTLTPDRVLVASDGSVRVQRIRTGRETKSEPEKPIYALLRQGAAERYSGKSASVEIYYLASGKTVPTNTKSDEKAIGKYAEAIAAIEQGEFKPAPQDARSCPNCPCYFICEG